MIKKNLLQQANEFMDAGDEDKAYELLLEAAMDETDDEAVFELGELYLHWSKEGTEDSAYDKAAHYFEVAYERGRELPGFCYIVIACSYERGGCGRKADVPTAIEWYQRGANAGEKFAFACIGEHYYLGNDVKQNYKKAYRLFKDAGDASTMPLYYLGVMYENGLYVKKNIDKAKAYYRMVLEDSYVWASHGYQFTKWAEERLDQIEKSTDVTSM